MPREGLMIRRAQFSCDEVENMDRREASMASSSQDAVQGLDD
jgi:hypothetical protein